LQTFCASGDVPGDPVVKEILKYRLLDIIAFIHDVASESNTKERKVVPFIEKIVRHPPSVTLLSN